MNIFLKVLITAQILFLLVSCNHQTSVPEKGPMPEILAVDKPELAFDSCMGMLIDRYKYDDFFRPIKGSTYHEAYPLEVSSYIPSFRNLTFEYRELGQISEAFSPVVYLHNDSTKFVLSFLDLQYYKWNAFDSSNTLEPGVNLHLESELNHLVSTLDIKDKAEVIELLDILMGFFKADRIKGAIDVKYFAARAEYFMLQGTKKSTCDIDIKESIKKVYQSAENPNQVIYTDGVLTFIFGISNKLEIKTEVLNTSCYY